MGKLNFNLKISNKKGESDLEQFRDDVVEIRDLLEYATKTDCSDLYIKVGMKPYISRFGKLIEVPCVATTEIEWSNFYDYYVSEELNADYVREKLLDTSISIRAKDNKIYRYRVSLGFSEQRNVATFRMIRPVRLSFKNINFEQRCIDALRKGFSNRSGIVIMSGATGSGKSTTLSACMNDFTMPNDVLSNKAIISLEDPIENIFYSSENVRFIQKELGKDFKTYMLGIKQALREHPNVINVGECRDKEVITAAIEASRTGHLVSTSFHAKDVAGTISRMSFYLDDPNMIYDLIINLNIIISQRLEASDNAYIVKTQYMVFTDEIKKKVLDIIRTGHDLAIQIEELFKDKSLKDQGLVKDWDD